MVEAPDVSRSSSLAWRTLLRPDVMRRIAVTIGAICAYRLGAVIPAPGIDLSLFATSQAAGGSSVAAITRLSIFALGLVPILSAMIFGEVLKLAIPQLRAAVAARERAHTIFNRIVLVIAAFQAFGVAVAVEQINLSGTPIVPQPGGEFRFGLVATLVAATALVAFLADVITRHGIGSGFWILLLATSIADLAFLPGDLNVRGEMGLTANGQSLLLCGFAVAAVAALVTLERAMPDCRRCHLGRSISQPPWRPMASSVSRITEF
jgi:preprotein translocase subunit SecY